jgi:hypothetical protein
MAYLARSLSALLLCVYEPLSIHPTLPRTLYCANGVRMMYEVYESEIY